MPRYVLIHPTAGVVGDFEADDVRLHVYRTDGLLGDRIPLHVQGDDPELVRAIVDDCDYECTLTP